MSKKELLNKNDYKFDDLVEIVDILRAPGGCPWDMEQTHQSIRKGLIEETYEVIEGIDASDDEIMTEELGDLILQVVFHASIAKDRNAYDIDKICDGICKKLIYRHPHVFADVSVENSQQVLKNWDELKKKEKGQKSTADELLSVSKALPSLMRTQKLIKKSKTDVEELSSIDNIENMLSKLKNAADVEKEDILGDILFECGKLGNVYKSDLEQVLFDKNDRFCDKKTKNVWNLTVFL